MNGIFLRSSMTPNSDLRGNYVIASIDIVLPKFIGTSYKGIGVTGWRFVTWYSASRHLFRTRYIQLPIYYDGLTIGQICKFPIKRSRAIVRQVLNAAKSFLRSWHSWTFSISSRLARYVRHFSLRDIKSAKEKAIMSWRSGTWIKFVKTRDIQIFQVFSSEKYYQFFEEFGEVNWNLGNFRLGISVSSDFQRGKLRNLVSRSSTVFNKIQRTMVPNFFECNVILILLRS